METIGISHLEVFKYSSEIIEILNSKYTEIRPFYEGMAAVCRTNNEKKRYWGFININGEEIINTIYVSVEDFSFGKSNVEIYHPRFKFIEVLSYQIDYEGKVILQIDDKDLRLAYEVILPFNKFCMRVFRQKHWGLINNNGIEVLPCIYGCIDNPNEGLAEISDGYSLKERSNFRRGLIDEHGKIVIPLKYHSYKRLSERYFIIETCKSFGEKGRYWSSSSYGIYDIEKQIEVIPCYFTSVSLFKDNLAEVFIENYKGYFNKDGLLLFTRDGKESYINYHMIALRSDGFYTCFLNEFKGVIDHDENVIVPCKYYNIKEFVDGFAIIISHTESIRTGNSIWETIHEYKYGIINDNGVEVLPCIYDEIDTFSCGLARFKVGNKWGFLNYLGEEFISPRFDFASPFDNNVSVVSLDKRYSLIDTKGEMISKTHYKGINKIGSNFYRAEQSEGYYLLNCYGEDFLGYICDYISTYTSDECVLIRKGDDYAILNLNGEILIPFGYRYLSEFSEGLAVFGIEGENGNIKYGYINRNNEIVISAKYDNAQDFYEGKGNVIVNSQDESGLKCIEYVIDQYGEVLETIENFVEDSF